MNITVETSVTDSAGGKDYSTLQLNISPPEPLDCDLITQDLCYWQSATYRIYENRNSSVIGTLSSPYLAEICQGFQLDYVLIKGKYFHINPDRNTSRFVLLNRKGIDTSYLIGIVNVLFQEKINSSSCRPRTPTNRGPCVLRNNWKGT